jgi:multidrug efflux pump subunit AcrB
LPLKDLLRIRRGFAEPASDLAFYDGKRAIVISASITPGVNAVEFGERLTAKVRDLEARLPIGYVLDFATFQPDLVQKAVDGALTNVYQTLVIVLIVVVIFLGLRTGLIVGSFVPMTMLMGLIIMRFVGVELERISIASAIIALGMLVDNGIVTAEDIRNRLERGEERRTACLNTAETLAIPLLTSSLTTILAFVPILLLSGDVGEYAFSLPVVVTILLLSSWFLSMYMTPFMCFWFMKVNPKGGEGGQPDEDPYSGKIYVIYRAVLSKLLDKRFVVLIATFAVLAGGGYVGSQLVREMFGHSDRNQFLIYVDLPAGSSIETTEEVVQRLTGWLSDESVNPEITGTIAYVGTGGPRFVLVLAPFDPDPHRAFIIASTQTGDQVPEIRIYGPDAWPLYAKGVEFTDRVRAIPGTIDIRNNWENTVIKAPVLIDQARARRAGISSLEVANSLEAYIDGIKASDYREGDQAIPIVLQSVPEERAQGSDFYNMRIHAAGIGADATRSARSPWNSSTRC